MYTIAGRRKLKFSLKIDSEHIHVLRNIICSSTFSFVSVRNTEVMLTFNVSLQNLHLCNKVFINKMKLVYQDMYMYIRAYDEKRLGIHAGGR
jgi:hypothetical protein